MSQAGSAVDQTNQYGNLNYQVYTDANGVQRLKANTNLSPDQQQLFDTQVGTQKTAGQAGSNLLSSANYGAAPDLGTDASSRVSQNLSRFTSSLNPQFTAQSENLDNQLRNQGLTPGTQAYDRATTQLRSDQGNIVNSYLAQAEPQAFNEAVTSYQQPLNTATDLAKLGQPGSPQASLINTPTANYAPINYAGIQSDVATQKQNNYKAAMASHNALMQGLFSLGGTILGGPIGGALGGTLGSAIGGTGIFGAGGPAGL